MIYLYVILDTTICLSNNNCHCSLLSNLTSKIYKMASPAVQHPNVSDYLSKKQKESNQDLASDWAEIEELHNKK